MANLVAQAISPPTFQGGCVQENGFIDIKIMDNKGAFPKQLLLYPFDREAQYLTTSFQVLDVLESFGRHFSSTPGLKGSEKSLESKWIGKANFLPHIYFHVKQNAAVQLTIPAFPCKSANREAKVLGHLPDLGEEWSLSRLDKIAREINLVYPPGAQVNIATDGLLFNGRFMLDILGITDEDTWEYAVELLSITRVMKLRNLRIIHPQSILGLLEDANINRESYLATTQLCREKLLEKFGGSEKDLDKLITTDKDTTLTYCGMAKFLETETCGSLVGKGISERRRVIKRTARKMMKRSEAFTLAIRTLRPHDVRLSMHPSSGATKLSIPMTPTRDLAYQKSPWHSCIAVEPDGSYRSVHSAEVKDTHDLVYRNNRPYYYVYRHSILN